MKFLILHCIQSQCDGSHYLCTVTNFGGVMMDWKGARSSSVQKKSSKRERQICCFGLPVFQQRACQKISQIAGSHASPPSIVLVPYFMDWFRANRLLMRGQGTEELHQRAAPWWDASPESAGGTLQGPSHCREREDQAMTCSTAPQTVSQGTGWSASALYSAYHTHPCTRIPQCVRRVLAQQAHHC